MFSELEISKEGGPLVSFGGGVDEGGEGEFGAS